MVLKYTNKTNFIYWTDSLEYVLCLRTFRTTHVYIVYFEYPINGINCVLLWVGVLKVDYI